MARCCECMKQREGDGCLMRIWPEAMYSAIRPIFSLLGASPEPADSQDRTQRSTPVRSSRGVRLVNQRLAGRFGKLALSGGQSRSIYRPYLRERCSVSQGKSSSRLKWEMIRCQLHLRSVLGFCRAIRISM